MAKDSEEVIKIMFWLDHMSCISLILQLRPVIYTTLGLSIVCVIVSLVFKGYYGAISDESYIGFTYWAFIGMLIASIIMVILINL